MDPRIGAGLITGGANLIGSLFGNTSQYKAARYSSDMAYKTAQEQMAWQEQMMDKQNQWSLGQWNRENAYNSASAQVQRFREAGINPALAMTGGANAGMGSSLESASPASSPNMPQQYVPNYDFSGIGRAGESIAQMLYNAPLQAAQVVNLNSQSGMFKANMDESFAREKNEKTRNAYYHWEAQDKELSYEINKATKQLQIDGFTLQNDYLRAQANLMRFSAKEKEIMNQYLPEKMQTDIALSNQHIAKLAFDVKRGEKLLPHEIRALQAKISSDSEHALLMAAQRGLIPELSDDDRKLLGKAFADNAIYGAMEQEYNAYAAQYDSHSAEYNSKILESRLGMSPAPGSSRATAQWWLEHIPFAGSFNYSYGRRGK